MTVSMLLLAPEPAATTPAPNPVVRLEELATLRLENATLRAENVVLQERIRELEARLGQNSSKSSRPPSSGPPQAPARPKAPQSGRKRGGQPRHRGTYRALLPYALIIGVVLSLTGLSCARPAAQAVAVDKPPASPAESGAGALSPGGAVSVAPVGSAPLQRVTVGVTRAAADSPLFVADEHGYFQEAGLTVSFEEFQSGAALIPPVSTGQIDVGGGGLSVGLYNAIARGVTVRAVADRARESGIGVLVVRQALAENGRVRGASDIRGLRLVLPADCIASEVTLQRYLDRYGVTMQEVDMRLLPLADLPTAIANGSADLGVVPEPFATVLEQSGRGVILHRLGSDLEPYRQLSVILYSPAFAEDRDRATGFMVAYLRGVRDYYDAFFGSGARRDDVIRLLVEKTTNKRPDLYDERTMPLIDPNGEINIQSMVEDQDYYLARGCQPQPIDIARSVDSTFREAAVARLGRYSR